MCLLLKKGYLLLLQNWRLISLTNCDSRILDSHIIHIAKRIIDPHQIGFMSNRFISDDGIILKFVSGYGQKDPQSKQKVAFLLYFMKAYDRLTLYISALPL